MNNFLKDFAQFIKDNNENIYSVAQFTPEGGAESIEIQQCNACNNTYSVAKVFTVTAIGFLYDMGLIKTDEIVSDILADEIPENYNKNWDKTTVDMLLRHRVGLPGGSLDIDCLDASKFNADYLAEVMLQEWSCEPDTQRIYTDAAFYVLSRIAAKRAGKPMQLFLWEKLFLPLGFKEVAWSCCPKGHAMGATGLYIRSDDMVKLGALYLCAGKWQGEQIISQNWVDIVLEREYEFHPTGKLDAYSKGGMRGQNLLVIPSQNKVLGWLGHRRGDGADFDKFIYEYKN